MLSIARQCHGPVAACPQRGMRGFTLIELIVAIAVVGILVAVAVPSFASLVNGNRLTASVNELAAGIQSARMEAIRRNSRVVLCRSDNGSTCNAGAGSWKGWISFVDANADNAPDGGVGSILRAATVPGTVEIDPSPSVSGNSNLIIVRTDGMVRANDRSLLRTALLICMPTSLPPENQRLLTLFAGSRITVTRADGGGNCVAPVDPT